MSAAVAALIARISSAARARGFTGVLLVIIALLLINTYADIAFKGPLGIGLHFEGWKPKALRHKHDLANVAAAQKQALKAAQEAKERAERQNKELAERIDNDAEKARAGAMDDAERFIRANRVRCEAPGGSAGRTVAATADHSAGNSQGAGRAPVVDAVAVSAEDVRICTINTVKAEAGHDLATSLEASTR